MERRRRTFALNVYILSTGRNSVLSRKYVNDTYVCNVYTSTCTGGLIQ